MKPQLLVRVFVLLMLSTLGALYPGMIIAGPRSSNPKSNSLGSDMTPGIGADSSTVGLAGGGRVIVGFSSGDIHLRAVALAEKYRVLLISVNQALGFAVFQMGSSSMFAKEVSAEPGVRYVEKDVAFCILDAKCGEAEPSVVSKPPSLSSRSPGSSIGSKSPLIQSLSSPDFAIVANPVAVSFPLGGFGNTSVTLTSLNGFSGTVSLSASVGTAFRFPSGFFFSSYSVSLASGGSANVSLTLSLGTFEPAGLRSVTVTGTDSSLTLVHSVAVNFTATDFVLNALPSSRLIPLGSSATFNVNLTSFYGFAGTVHLNAAVSPSMANGPMASLTPANVSLTPGASSSSTLTVSTTSSTPSVGYSVLITGSSGLISHSICVAVNMGFPNDTCFGNQWAPSDLNLPSAWQKTVGTHKIIVALVDTGVRVDNQDLLPNLWTAPDGSHGWNCVNNSNNVTDDFGHGTATAGTIAAVINNGLGIAGAAQEQIMAIKAGDGAGRFFASTAACGIRWATDHGARIISMSFGVLTDFQSIHDAVAYAWNHGVLLVAAAGNDLGNTVVCPSCYSEVIAVSSLQGDDTLSSFSDYGPKIELAAPGTNIFSLCWPNSAGLSHCRGQPYAYLNGTSLSTPYVAGVAALVWDYGLQLGYRLSNTMIRSAMDRYAVHLGSAGRNPQFGYGKPDALSLLNNIQSIATADFVITVNPVSVTLPPGANVASNVNITSLNNFVGTVTLSSSTSPIALNGATATFGSTSVSLSANSTAVTSLTTSTRNETYAFTFNVTGTSGNISHTTWVYTHQDWSLVVSPTSLSLIPGSNSTVTFTANSIGGYQGDIFLAIISGLPSCVSYQFSGNGGEFSSGGKSTVNLMFLASTSCGPTSTTILLQGTSNDRTQSNPPPIVQTITVHSISIGLAIQDFGLSSASPNIWVAEGSTGNTTLTIQSLNGFAGSVTLSANGFPSGSSVTFNPNTVTITSGAQGATVMIISASAQVPVGIYPVTIVATSGTALHSISVNLKIAPASLNMNRPSLAFPQVSANATLSGTLVVNTASFRSLTGTIFLSSLNTTTGANIYSNSIQMTLPFGDSNNGIIPIVLEIPAFPLWLSINCQINLTSTSSPTCFLSRTPDINHNGQIDLQDYSFVQTRFGSTPSSSNWDPEADLNANKIVDLQDVSVETVYFGGTVFLPLIASSANPNSLAINTGSSGSATIVFSSIGFSGNITLSTIVSPTGPTCSISTTNMRLTTGTNGTSTLYCSTTSSVAGNYTATVKGTAGSLSVSFSILIMVRDFSISTNVGSVSVSKGSAAILNITLTSMNGFSSTVILSATVSPVVNHGPSTAFSPASVTLASRGTGSSKLTVTTLNSTPAQTYTITITATSGSTTHTISVTVTVS